MMTGYGYNTNLVQQPPVLQGVTDEWGQVSGQSQYYHTENGTTGLSNPMFYGSEWYQPPNFNYPADGCGDQMSYQNCHQNQDGGHQGNQPISSLMHTTNLTAPPQPRVSISDEELFKALNMSPLPSATGGFPGHQQQMPQIPQIQQSNTEIDYLSSEICFPSTSNFETPNFKSRGYIPPASSIPPEDPHMYHHCIDVDDEGPYGVPERYETMSPTFSIHSFAPTTSTNTAEAEDLEVELINNHKPTPRYQMNDGIDIFLHTGTTDDTEYNEDSDSRPTTTYSHRSNKAPSPPAPRPAYAKKLSAAAHSQKPEPKPSEIVSPISKTSPLYLQTTGAQDPAGFTPLLTPNSDALLQKKLNEVVHKPPQRAVGLNAFPAFPQQLNLNGFQENQRYETSFCQPIQPVQQVKQVQQDSFYSTESLNQFDYDTDRDILPLLLDSFKPLPPPEIPIGPVIVPVSIPERLTSTKKVPTSRAAPSAPIKAPRLSDQELESESQKLALDVISNLFTNKKEIIDRAAKINAPKKPVARNLFCLDKESLEKARSSEPSSMSVLEDWETADDDDLTVRMENLLKDKKKEEVKQVKTSAVLTPPPKTSDWDPTFLQHVLEIHSVPDYKMQGDVVKAMETMGNGDCKVMWIERKVVFAVFENVNRAKNCLALSRHDWIRFRSLVDSPRHVQEAARNNASNLSLPKKKQQTTATVARRMVENALGKKATVTIEKRQEERKQLAAAKAAKKNTVQWD
ncbi:hypothetical protein GCK72_023159 [Caenorhabditis remanei]|uniref:Uncharacterized protein n=1 Tax=Caenorhabditis remanei TaxID=31234 RepID=A0A6A5FVZ4_CAERE|nr:hypothetical protein GCK72_023159 [Caenorhabditis remanei]KAF1746702.1 hypothetical protein GCK72_023159 [Caenorhabditis remanei]